MQGLYADAEQLIRRALAIEEKALPKGHPGVAITLNKLAGLYRVQGRYADAERYSVARSPSRKKRFHQRIRA